MIKIYEDRVCIVSAEVMGTSMMAKPAGTPIKCFFFTDEGGEAAAIRKATEMHAEVLNAEHGEE